MLKLRRDGGSESQIEKEMVALSAITKKGWWL